MAEDIGGKIFINIIAGGIIIGVLGFNLEQMKKDVKEFWSLFPSTPMSSKWWQNKLKMK